MASSNSQLGLPQNYIDEFIGHRLTITASIFIALETIFVAIRLWSRRLQKASVGWDDRLIIPSYISCLSLCICGILAVQHGGVGHHITALEETSPEKITYWGNICLMAITVLSSPAVTLPKLVILAMFLKIFVDKPSRIVCYVVAAVLTILCILGVCMGIWKCSPPAFAWDKTIPGGYCIIDVQAQLRYSSLSNIVTDVVMLILPLPVVWRLQTSKRNKWGLTVTFLVGSIGLVSSILRFVEFFDTGAFEDGTWASVNLLIWSCVEPGMYLIAACLFALPTLLSTLLNNRRLASLRARLRNPRSYKRFSESTHVTEAVALQSFQKQNRDHMDLEDHYLALQPLGNKAIIRAERGESSYPILTDQDRIHVQTQITQQGNS